ncbi:MAG: histidinol-phosphatase HisJ family protein [Thermodesulfobacteriota bacterium]
MRLLIDGHVHTSYCHHAVGSMAEYVRAALGRGLGKIVFLEHLEKGIDYSEPTWLSEEEFAAFFAEGERLRREYAGRIEIGLGVEVGYNPEAVAELLEFLGRYRWDRIGLSHHFLRAGKEHLCMVSTRRRNLDLASAMGVAEVVRRYYAGLAEAIEIFPAQVVCHLDAVLRSHPDIGLVDQRPYLEPILTRMAEKDIALEVNTSGYAMRGQPFPDESVLQRAARLGIRLWPGSDAHRPEDVGRYFERLRSG